jgi:adenosylcobinamide-GDP ribazoletransferase
VRGPSGIDERPLHVLHLLLVDLRAAFALLTRLPVGGWPANGNAARCVWAYPLVGALVGAIGGGVYAAGRALALPAAVAALWALAALLLATGALHEDGLADTADAFGGGRTRERRLEIMRDSRIGSFGALALLVSTGLRVAAIAAMPPCGAVLALTASGLLGRGAILLPLALLAPARSDGLGATLAKVRPVWIATGWGIAVTLAFAVLPWQWALPAVMLAGGTGLGMAALARWQIGGFTGDVLGATSVIAECVVLTALADRL